MEHLRLCLKVKRGSKGMGRREISHLEHYEKRNMIWRICQKPSRTLPPIHILKSSILEGYNYMGKSKPLMALPSMPLLTFKETLVCMCLVERWATTTVSLELTRHGF